MITEKLPKVVKMVSSLVKNQSVNSFTNKNNLIISTDIWEFHFIRIPENGFFIYEKTVIRDSKSDKKNKELKDILLREVITKYEVTLTL